MTVVSVIGSALALALLIFKWWTDEDKKKQEKFDNAKKAIHDAIASGNHELIHSIVDKLRR